MVSARMNDVYSPDEIARAAGVPEDAVVAAIGSPDALVSLAEAVRIGRTLSSGVRSTSGRTSAATVLSASRPPLGDGATPFTAHIDQKNIKLQQNYPVSDKILVLDGSKDMAADATVNPLPSTFGMCLRNPDVNDLSNSH